MVMQVSTQATHGVNQQISADKPDTATPITSADSKSVPDDTVYSKLTVSVVIPALNEADNLPHVLPRIPHWVHEVILVDGYSTDNTVEIAQTLLPSIRIIVQEGRGKGAALRSGVRAATGDIVVMLDADGSTDPVEIPIFVAALLAGADFAKGSRFLQGAGTVDMPRYRQFGNWGLTTLTNILFNTRYTDITYGYNAFWRKYAEYLAWEIDGWANEIVSSIRVAWCGLRVVEVASFEHERIAGEAKLATFSAGWVILKAILREFFKKAKTPKATPILRGIISFEAYFRSAEHPVTHTRLALAEYTADITSFGSDVRDTRTERAVGGTSS